MIEFPRAFQPYIICRVWEDLNFFSTSSKASVQYEFSEVIYTILGSYPEQKKVSH